MTSSFTWAIAVAFAWRAVKLRFAIFTVARTTFASVVVVLAGVVVVAFVVAVVAFVVIVVGFVVAVVFVVVVTWQQFSSLTEIELGFIATFALGQV